MSSPHTFHEWRERSEDGETRYFRAWRGLGQWNFTTTLKTEPDWHPILSPDKAFLESLRAKLFSKYQRRRVPWEQIEEIDKMIAAFGDSPEDDTF